MKRSAVALLVLLGACSSEGPGGGGQTGAAGGGGAGTGGPAGAGGAGAGGGAKGEAGAGAAGAGGAAGQAGAGAAGAGGAAGQAGAGVAGQAGAASDASAPDAVDGGGRDAPGADAPAAGDAAKLQECTMPSIDRIQSWNATQGEGDMVPSGGSLLVKEGDHYVAKVTLNGTGWHVLPVYLSNAAGGGMVDLSTSTGFTLTYSTTADLWIQMRPANHWNGGVQWVTKIPSSGGVLQSRFFSLAKESWSFLQQLGGMPSWPYEEARTQVRGFVIVGNLPNTVVFAGLRFDGYVPACRP